MKLRYIFFTIFTFYHASIGAMEVKTPFGPLEIQDPMVLELIQMPLFQRLKGLAYLGLHANLDPVTTYSRYDHIMGILYIIQHLPVSQQEKANILAPHMTEMALIDDPFSVDAQTASEQREHREKILKDHQIQGALNTYNLSLDEVMDHLHKSLVIHTQFPSPFDYLEYILHFGILKGKITPEEAETVIKDLQYDESQKIIYFKTMDIAKKVGTLSLEITKIQQQEPERLAVYHWLKEMRNHALKRNFLTLDDLYQKTDAEILRMLEETEDAIIESLFDKIKTPTEGFEVTEDDGRLVHKDVIHFPVRYYPLDPWVETKNFPQPLTNIDSNFQEAYNLIIRDQAGVLLQFTN